MIHSFAKVISKILALRLAPKLDALVDKNQNAFIRDRTIQDNFKYIQRASVLIRKKRVPMLLLKLDISKAFDTLSWPFLLELLQARGFGGLARNGAELQMGLCIALDRVIEDHPQRSPWATDQTSQRSAPG